MAIYGSDRVPEVQMGKLKEIKKHDHLPLLRIPALPTSAGEHIVR